MVSSLPTFCVLTPRKNGVLDPARYFTISSFTSAYLYQLPDTDLHQTSQLFCRELGLPPDCARPFLFNPNHYYMAITGIPKRIYSGKLHIHRKTYMNFLEKYLIPHLESFMQSKSYHGFCYLQSANNEPQRHLVMLFTPAPHSSKKQVMNVIEELNASLNAIYQAHFAVQQPAFSNSSALVGPIKSLDDAASFYHQAESLIGLRFFTTQPHVFTLEHYQRTRFPLCESDLLDQLNVFETELIRGVEHAVSHTLSTLIHNSLQQSLNLPLCEQLLSLLKNIDHRFCVRHQLAHASSSLYELDSYIHINECFEALCSRFLQLCKLRETEAKHLSRVSRDAVYHIRLHYKEPLSLESVAAALYVSAAHLSRVFNRDMHISIHQYICTVRLAHAKRLLTETAMPINQIALAVGLTAPLHFTRLFKQYEHMTPSAYREQYRNRNI